jgi:hypothetical protein
MDHKLIDSNVTETNYNQLMSILYDERDDNEDRDKLKDRKDNTSDSALIIDVESIIAALDVLGKAGNIPAALTLLRLSVELIVSQRNELEDDDCHNRRNELRRIYKTIFSLLGHTYNKRAGSTYHTKLIIHILQHHMLDVAHMAPSVEIYHAAINALGKIGELPLFSSCVRMRQKKSASRKPFIHFTRGPFW